MPVTATVAGDGKQITIHVSGQFNFSVYKDFREAYQRSAQPADTAYVIDMAGADYMDSSALGMLLLLRERAGGERSEILITHSNPEIRKIFKISNFERLFKID